MKEISLICVYNNEEQVNNMVESAKKYKGDIDIETILVDNTKNAFSSAAKALNYGYNKSTKDIVVFLHQDIVFNSSEDINYICDFLSKKPDSIVGVAGVNNGTAPVGIITSIYTGNDNERNLTLTEDYEEVFTLDECLIATTRMTFEKLYFDEVTCDNWHLYGADLCISAHTKNINVYVIKTSVRHISSGKANKGFYITQRKLAEKHRKNFDRISYTFGWTYTNPIKYQILHISRIIKHRKIMYY